MDIRMQTRAVTLLYRLFVRNQTGAYQIPYIPSKTRIPPSDEEVISLVPPEEVGLSSREMDEFLATLEQSRGCNLHLLAASRAGKPFLLAAAPGYSTTYRHETYSLCKTLTGLAVGLLYDEGKIDLDTPAYRYIPSHRMPTMLSSRTRAITVRHLLTMTSGVAFCEIGAVTEEDWVRSFFESGVKFTPGSRFAYNSMNSHLLSAIVEEITGETMADFVARRLFAPLGIRDTLWEICPEGHTKGGWGLYLSVGDMLKVGELIAEGGVFRGTRLLSHEWMQMMTKTQVKTPETLCDYDYGFHIWTARDSGACLANGMLGQDIWISPQNRLVVAMNAGNCELFQTGPMLPIVSRTFTPPLPSAPQKPDRRATAALRAHEAVFFRGRTWTHAQPFRAPMRDGVTPAELWARLAAKPYYSEKNNFGILPLFMMFSHNNLSGGIVSFTFLQDRAGDACAILLKEGQESYRLPVGFGDYRETTLVIRGEHYRVATRAEFCDDTDGEPILKLDILFPEMASARRIRFYYADEEPYVVLSENPGRKILDRFLDFSQFVPRAKLLGGIIRSQLERETIAYRVRECFEPMLRLGQDISLPLDTLSGLTLGLSNMFGEIEEEDY